MRLIDIKPIAEGEVIAGNFPQHGKFLLSQQRDAGSERLYWNGVNWFAMKKNALAVPAADVDKLVKNWSPYNLKKEPVKKVSEEALETQKAEDLWSENKDSASNYNSTATYQVRAIKDSKPTKYEAFSVIGSKRKPYGEFNAGELESALKPIRPNQTPDAEGFTIYTDPSKVEAFLYKGDPVKLEVANGKVIQLDDGDYVVRTVDKNNFVYSVEEASDFEAALKKA